MAVSSRLLSADEYLAGPPDGRRTELVAGEIVVNEPAVRHQRVALRLLIALQRWTDGGPGRGEAFLPLDVRLDEANVYAPDVLWLSEARRPGWEVLNLSGPPDLAVEVRSPSTWRYDVGVKRAVYGRLGLPELWLVDTTARTVLVLRRLSPSAPTFDIAEELPVGAVLSSPLLPDFELSIGDLFAE